MGTLSDLVEELREENLILKQKIKQLKEVPKVALVMKMFGKKARELTPEEMREYKRQYYLQNRQQVITRATKWKKDNKDRCNTGNKIRREKNLEKRREYEREYKKKQRCSVRLYKLALEKACIMIAKLDDCAWCEAILTEDSRALDSVAVMSPKLVEYFLNKAKAELEKKDA